VTPQGTSPGRCNGTSGEWTKLCAGELLDVPGRGVKQVLDLYKISSALRSRLPLFEDESKLQKRHSGLGKRLSPWLGERLACGTPFFRLGVWITRLDALKRGKSSGWRRQAKKFRSGRRTTPVEARCTEA
jgi:hypothetical protein